VHVAAVWSSQIERCSRSDELTGALMARRPFDVPNVTEILVHWDAGRSQSEIATSLGLDPQDGEEVPDPADRVRVGAWLRPDAG
jgi:hypothetical protein